LKERVTKNDKTGRMEATEKIQLLKDEYLLLQRFYEDFDTRVLTIKGWSATIGIAAIGVGFYQSTYVWLFAAGASLAFWFLEALWKSFQYCHGPRIEQIERAFRDEDFANVRPFQIYTSWNAAWRMTRVHLQLRAWLTAVPHVVTFVVGAGLFILQHVYGVQLVQARH
jgi:hypothetical protein